MSNRELSVKTARMLAVDAIDAANSGHPGLPLGAAPALNAVFTAIFTFLAFAIAQFGLMAVVSKGYAYLGYAACITLFIPFVVHAIGTRFKEI